MQDRFAETLFWGGMLVCLGGGMVATLMMGHILPGFLDQVIASSMASGMGAACWIVGAILRRGNEARRREEGRELTGRERDR